VLVLLTISAGFYFILTRDHSIAVVGHIIRDTHRLILLMIGLTLIVSIIYFRHGGKNLKLVLLLLASNFVIGAVFQ